MIVACPTAGLLLTLVAWGAAADRCGERRVLAAGLGVAGLVLLVAARARGMAALGACLVWPRGPRRFCVRGERAAHPRLVRRVAARAGMGIRQSAQPLGVAVAAVGLPTLAARGLAAASDLPRRVLPGRGAAGDRGVGTRPATGAGGAQRRLALPDRSAVADPRGERAAGRAAVHRGHLRAGLPGQHPRLARARPPARCWRPRRPPVPRPGWGPDTGPTGSAAGCGRCGSSPWPSRPPCWPWPGGGRRPGAGRAHPAGRRGAGGEHQRARLHRGGRVRRAGLGGPRARHPEHRAERGRRATPPLVAVLIGAAGYPAAFAVAGVLPLAAAALVPLAADRRAPPRAEAAPAAQAR